MIVIPFTCAFTSSRRFTLLNVFNASAIAVFGTPHDSAIAAAAVAFHTLYSPASGNSRSAQGLPSRNTVQLVRSVSRRRSETRQLARGPAPYRSTGQNALARQRSRLGLSFAPPAAPSKATILPRRGTRFTRRLNAVSTASRSL